MDTPDKQYPDSTDQRYWISEYRRVKNERNALQKEVVELRQGLHLQASRLAAPCKSLIEAERQRLREAVNERKRTYFNRIQRHHQSDGQWLLEIFAKGEDECEWFLSLLESGSGKEETNKTKDIRCRCSPEKKHGETSVMCCNECGLPTEASWTTICKNGCKKSDDCDDSCTD